MLSMYIEEQFANTGIDYNLRTAARQLYCNEVLARVSL